ncbi:MAG: glycine cleavage system aminomethyltransferase GcvT [Pirellulaceae bacterium]|jgi:aminomethyltransferase|nr:glycine cleavage system aminomethyltransferase GcvT [Pirellulaceae bacterium]
MADDLLRTPLYAWHADHQARLVAFAGWEMPVSYTSIVEEHQATRQALGLFDISHMGRLEFDGPGALAFLDRLVTRRVARMAPGQIRYALVTNENGGILDDVLVYALASSGPGPRVLMVVNASNRPKILAWLQRHLTADESVVIRDTTRQTAMIAVQGPTAIEVVAPQVDVDLRSMKYYSGAVTRLGATEIIISRTGYTGEDGCELIVPAASALTIWQQLVDLATPRGGRPAGLAARDTLRLEAGMPLYGHELSEDINPLQAGLDFAVQLRDHEFVGCHALQADAVAPARRRVGLQLDQRRVPREGYPVVHAGQVVGAITSGTFSPTFNRPIAMAYVEAPFATVGQLLDVDIRGRLAPAAVTPLPFYSRHSK